MIHNVYIKGGLFHEKILNFKEYSTLLSSIISRYNSVLTRKEIINIGLWKYSRHPNYLGEMSFWTGLYVYFLFANINIWYFGLPFLSLIALFVFISIPMMEKHNMENRVDYEEYKKKTSVLFILPNKK